VCVGCFTPPPSTTHLAAAWLALFGTQDAAEALRLLPPAAGVGRDLDEHVGLWDVQAVVADLFVCMFELQ
jgi:hypothetical protein